MTAHEAERAQQDAIRVYLEAYRRLQGPHLVMGPSTHWSRHLASALRVQRVVQPGFRRLDRRL